MYNFTQGNFGHQDIVFNVDDGTEVMRLCKNGDIIVKGQKVENAEDVVEGMRMFLNNRRLLGVWNIERTDSIKQGETASMKVCADTEKEARFLASQYAGPEGSYVWEDEKLSMCSEEHWNCLLTQVKR